MEKVDQIQLSLRQTRAALREFRKEGASQRVNARKCLRGIARMKQELRAAGVPVIDEITDAPQGDEGTNLYY